MAPPDQPRIGCWQPCAIVNLNTPSAVSASILVVDDTPANLQLLGDVLRQLGFAVRLASSGQAALDAARLLPPDLVLLDVRMPKMNGYEVCARLKGDDHLKDIPVIFISALGDTEDKVKAFEAGGMDYVTKPFQVEEIEARVRAHLENHRMKQEIQGQNARLERTVQERTRQLAESNAKLAQLDKAKSDFLTVISHELRTPLSVLLGVAELAFSEFPAHPQFIAYKKMFEESRQRLMRLMDDALLLCSIQVNDTPLLRQAVRVDDVLADAAAEVRVLAGEREVQIAKCAPCLAEVTGDRFFLTKAVAYLLKTGVKLSQQGHRLLVGLDATSEEVFLVLKADGYSVPERDLPDFFEVLAIGKAVTPEGDLGLSPAVAAQIIRLLGGRVEIANVAPRGVRLSVTMPRHRGGAGAEPEETAAQTPQPTV